MDKRDTLSHIIDISLPITEHTVGHPHNSLVHIDETRIATSIRSTEGALGIDALSIKRRGSADLRPHTA